MMYLQKSIGILGLFLFFMLIFSTNTFSGSKYKKQSVKVGIRIASHEGLNEIDKMIHKIMKSEIEQRAIFSKNPEFEFYIQSKILKQENENQIVFSVITSIKLPKEVIELGKKNEIFYSIYGTRKKWGDLPEEGKYIREYVTEDYLQQFCDIYDFETYIFPETKLQEQCKKIIDDFFKKYLPMKGKPK